MTSFSKDITSTLLWQYQSSKIFTGRCEEEGTILKNDSFTLKVASNKIPEITKIEETVFEKCLVSLFKLNQIPKTSNIIKLE
ncbi:14450_t:CDS:2, partial [Dentiscutata erythropus]